MKRAVLYARVSSDDRGREGRNLDGQLDMCRKYAGERGYSVVAELSEDDRGASGAEIDLPQLNRAREMAQADEYDVLVVRELDRLSRNLAKQLIVEQELKRTGVQIEYVLGEYPDTPEGNLMKHVRATIAEFEREKITERMVRGRRQKAQAGHVMCHGKPKYGYRIVEKNGKETLEIYEPEARIVRLIFQLATEGDESGKVLSAKQIAVRLTDMRVPTWGDVHAPTMRRKGRPGYWYDSTVRKTLHSETYKGQFHYGQRNNRTRVDNPREHWLTVEVPAIVSEETWNAAQRQLRQNETMAKRNTRRAYLLRCRIRCGWCGCAAHGGTRISHGTEYKYYWCNSDKSHTAHGRCGMPSFRVEEVDTAVWNWVKSFLTDPARLVEGLRAEQSDREETNRPLRERLAVIDDLLSDNRAQLERALGLYLTGDFPREVLTEHKTRLETALKKLEQERAELVVQIESRALTDGQMQSIAEYAREIARGLEIADEDFDAKRRVIDLLDVRVMLSVENGEYLVYASCMLDSDTLLIEKTTTKS